MHIPSNVKLKHIQVIWVNQVTFAVVVRGVHIKWQTDQLDFLCFLFCTPLMKLLNYSIQRTRNWINKKRQKHYYLISKWNHLAKCHKLGKYYHNTYSFIDLDELSISSLSKTIRYGISAISKKKISQWINSQSNYCKLDYTSFPIVASYW